MRYTRVIWFVVIALISCKEDSEENNSEKQVAPTPRKVVKLDGQKVPDRLLTLNTESNHEVLQGAVKGNLFGKFFCDRAEFYIIKNPQNNVFSAKANSIVLYYLDQQLRQTKYILSNDIVAQLVNSLGNFSITGLDKRNSKIIMARRVVTKKGQRWEFNEELDNYELEWTYGDKQIKYRVSPHNFEGPYVYLEKVKDYEKEFKALEHYCI